MTIDIIAYSQEQYADFTEEQILQVRSAQLKKNKLERQLREDIEKEKQRLIDQGIFSSPMWEKYKQVREEEYNQELANVRDALLFYLQYSLKLPEDLEAPYTIDFSLSAKERVDIVRTYYEETYPDADERFQVFENDEVARVYLGEAYSPLHSYFKADTIYGQ